MAGRQKIQLTRSSLSYQVILYLNGWYFAFYFISEVLMFIYKSQVLPYPKGVFAAELLLLFVMAGLESIRLFFGKKGNLTERILSVVLCVVISIPAFLGAFYNLYWQTYVLRVEFIMSAIQLCFICLELIFSIISIIMFARAKPY
ncbi:hypothetical protein LSAT2_012597 [Lamellibrachia satsuma]|nr:hypothetical protein LSAT2_012597 [Lamellibrachia satsuma]